MHAIGDACRGVSCFRKNFREKGRSNEMDREVEIRTETKERLGREGACSL